MNAIVDTRTPDPKKFIKGATGDWEIIIGIGNPCAGDLASEIVFRRVGLLWR